MHGGQSCVVWKQSSRAEGVHTVVWLSTASFMSGVCTLTQHSPGHVHAIGVLLILICQTYVLGIANDMTDAISRAA